MFTGIIEEVGRIREAKKQRGGVLLRVGARKVLRGLGVNDSIAINGTCLTVVSRQRQSFQVLAVEETLKKTALNSLNNKTRVNLERPLSTNARFGGHLVMGHVDCVGVIRAIEERRSSWMFTISYPRRFSRYVIPVGSISVDGVSLTVAELRTQSTRISIIPHTWTETIFQFYKVGDRVNLEFDLLGKYIERWVLMNPGESSLRSVKGYLRTMKSKT